MCYGFKWSYVNYYYCQLRKIYVKYMSVSTPPPNPPPTRNEIVATNREILQKLLKMVEKLEADVDHIKQEIKSPISQQEIFEDEEECDDADKLVCVDRIVDDSWFKWT